MSASGIRQILTTEHGWVPLMSEPGVAEIKRRIEGQAGEIEDVWRSLGKHDQEARYEWQTHALDDLRQRVEAIESRVNDIARQESEETQDIRESLQRMSDRLSTSGRREQWVTEYELQEVRRRLLDHLGHEHANQSLNSLIGVLISEHEEPRRVRSNQRWVSGEEGLQRRGDVYVRLSHAPVVRTERYYDDAVMVDVDERGNAIGVEVLGSLGVRRDGKEV